MDSDIKLLHSLVTQPGSGVTYRSMCERRVSVPAPPRFSFGDASNDLMHRYYCEMVTLPVGLYTASEIDVFHGSLLIRGGTFLQSDEIQMHGGVLPSYIKYLKSLTGSTRIRNESGTCALLLGIGYPIYGHWLADFLPKLFVLHQAGYDIMKLKYLVPEDTPGFGIAMLDLLGITAEKRIVYNQNQEIIRAEELLIPTMVRTNSRTSPLFRDAARFASTLIWNRNEKPALVKRASRIFVSRALANRDMRRLLNRDRIEEMAANSGFTVVHPEQMPLLEQFAIFSGAQHVIGEYGSAIHASLFSPAGTLVCLLRGTGSPVAGFLQSAMGEALDQPTGYVFGKTVADDPLECFTVSEDALKSCLDLIFSGAPLAENLSE